MSLTPKTVAATGYMTACFPAILDIGYTHNFLIQEQHLVRWANIIPHELNRLGDVRHGRQRLPRYDANLWLYRITRGTHIRLESEQPHHLETPLGITVYPANNDNFPRLPLLGTRALLASELHLVINGETKWASLRREIGERGCSAGFRER